jgi:hypothetical protein
VFEILANHAPVLDNTGDMQLDAILENDVTNTRTLVSAIIASAGGDRITDDPGSLEGIAVVAVDDAHGTWQYSLDGGSGWNAFGLPSSTSARLLAEDANTRVRFVPAPDFYGNIDPGLTFRAWDLTSGVAGGMADVSVNGGTTAFSEAVETASLEVLSSNVGPVLAAIESDPLAYTENDPAKAVTETLTLSDEDSPNLAGATVQITANYQNGQDVLAFANAGNITGTWTASTGTLALSGTDTVTNYQAALRAVSYQNTSDSPSGATRTVTFTVNDGELDSNLVLRNIAVTQVNDAPVLAGIESGPLAYAENDPPLAITASLAVSDVDNGNLVGATIQITANYQNGQDVLSFTNTASITGTWNASTGTLSLTGSDTPPNYQAALRAVTYQNSSENPSDVTRTVSSYGHGVHRRVQPGDPEFRVESV